LRLTTEIIYDTLKFLLSEKRTVPDLPPLNALRAFHAAGRLTSISAAAEALCVTPAAISRQIKLLETYLGVKLFHRQHRGIVLTPAGSEYWHEVARLMSGISRATADVMGKSRKTFKIRAPHSIAMQWLLPRLASFHMAHPTIDVKLSTGASPLDFEAEDIDAGIQLGRGGWKNVMSYKIVQNELVPVCTPERARVLKVPEDLAHETLLHTVARPDDWATWLSAAGTRSVDTSHGFTYESTELAYAAALGGYGIAIAQKALVEKELRDGRLVMPFDLLVDMGDFSYYAVLPLDSQIRKSAELDVFRQWVAKVATMS